MPSKLWIGAACLWGASACGHAPPAASMSASLSTQTQGQFSYLDAYSTGERLEASRGPRIALGAPAVDGSAGVDARRSADQDGDPIERFVLTRGIQDQKPVDEARTFKPGERVYAFVEIANPEGEKLALNLRWAHDNQDLAQPTAVTIGASKRWRAWSSHRAPEQPGSYRCVVETREGEPVAEIPFRVEI